MINFDMRRPGFFRSKPIAVSASSRPPLPHEESTTTAATSLPTVPREFDELTWLGLGGKARGGDPVDELDRIALICGHGSGTSPEGRGASEDLTM
jgi:hypothetical protein